MTLVGVIPGRELAARRRLFDALAGAYDVAFAPREAGQWQGLDAAVLFGGEERAGPPPPVPRLEIAGPAERSALAPGVVELHDHASLHPRLRGTRVEDRRAAGCAPLDRSSAGVPLASSGGATLWALVAGGAHPAYATAVAPEELGPREALRDHLRAGRFLSLLPLLEFLRSVTADRAWSFPRPRAAIVIDDPNLRRPSYGHLDYRTLVPHARAHGYHVAVAMVPLDARWTHPAAVRTFRDGRDVLSLLVHGNDHLRGELARSRGEPEAAAVVRQALERIMSFERRTHLSVSRVMAPPHEIWGEAFARAMVDSALEAMCADPGEGWRHELARGDPLADWWPAGVVAGGLPVVPRSRLSTPPADLRFRAYLGQPIVLYGHHWDLRHGLDALAGPAAEVGQIDDFEWTSLERIARSGVSTRARDGVLEVRMHARRAEIEIPPETSHVRVTLPPGATRAAGETVTWRNHDGAGIADLDETIRVAGASTIELRLVRQAVPDGRTARGRTRLWPLVRRGLTEGRDRLGAALARGRARGPRRAGS